MVDPMSHLDTDEDLHLEDATGHDQGQGPGGIPDPGQGHQATTAVGVLQGTPGPGAVATADPGAEAIVATGADLHADNGHHLML